MAESNNQPTPTEATPEVLERIQGELDAHDLKTEAIVKISRTPGQGQLLVDVLNITLGLIANKMLHVKLNIDDLGGFIVFSENCAHRSEALELMARACRQLGTLNQMSADTSRTLDFVLNPTDEPSE